MIKQEAAMNEISRQELAKASLRESWRLAHESGLEAMRDADIDAEIASMPKDRAASDADGRVVERNPEAS